MDLNQIAKDPAAWFLGIGVSTLVGVWWARMTPAQGNACLVLGVAALAVAVAIKTGGLSLVVRALWVFAVAGVVGLFVNYQMWTHRAETLDAKKAILATVADTEYRDVVAEVIHAFEPKSYISVAGAIVGPDGARSVDISVWPITGGVAGPTVVDVIDRSDGNPVGVDAVDVADSKRRDVKANAILLCSSTGFDATALRKAKRLHIGLISVLKRGDQRVRGRIEEEIYLRHVNVSPFTVDYEGATPADYATLRANMKATHDVTYRGGSVAALMQWRATQTVLLNPGVNDQPLVDRIRLIKPTTFDVRGHEVTLLSVSAHYRPKVQWLSQAVRLDAAAGIYDYVRGRVRLAGGQNQYVIEGINFDTATPIADAPMGAVLGVGLRPGELDVNLVMFTGLDLSQSQPADFSDLVTPEALSMKIANVPPAITP
jgi:hypothetical protein